MSSNKKNKKRKQLKKIPKGEDVIIVYRTTVPAEETLFPEKVAKANEILSKAKLLPR